LNEKLALRGASGFEDVSRHLNAYFSQLLDTCTRHVRVVIDRGYRAPDTPSVSSVHGRLIGTGPLCSQGGDVLKFAGDAVIVMFSTENDTLSKATRRCARRSMDLCSDEAAV